MGTEKIDKMILEVAIKMIDAVENFHKLGYLHRNIKPSNFRVIDGEVYITDFSKTITYRDTDGIHIKE